MKRLLFYATLLLTLPVLLTSCDETEELTDVEYTNWAERNDQVFLATLAQARTAVAAARARYGDDWTAHCPWRVFRTYAMVDTVKAKPTDSIAVYVQHEGTGRMTPIATDSIRMNFLGRYIPNVLSTDEEARTRGEVFAYSGVSKDSANIFSPNYCSPAKYRVSNNIEGVSTALQHMRTGDQWRIYVPSELAYGTTSSYVRASSMLIYTIELKGVWRSSTINEGW